MSGGVGADVRFAFNVIIKLMSFKLVSLYRVKADNFAKNQFHPPQTAFIHCLDKNVLFLFFAKMGIIGLEIVIFFLLYSCFAQICIFWCYAISHTLFEKIHRHWSATMKNLQNNTRKRGKKNDCKRNTLPARRNW